ncbi:neprilysin-like [Dermacentor variabilis]|uniref:neprilysin-like n=1 Tax=Dermacentor variabilis TaxID=34621 RepID=UPI003F5B1C47
MTSSLEIKKKKMSTEVRIGKTKKRGHRRRGHRNRNEKEPIIDEAAARQGGESTVRKQRSSRARNRSKPVPKDAAEPQQQHPELVTTTGTHHKSSKTKVVPAQEATTRPLKEESAQPQRKPSARRRHRSKDAADSSPVVTLQDALAMAAAVVTISPPMLTQEHVAKPSCASCGGGSAGVSVVPRILCAVSVGVLLVSAFTSSMLAASTTEPPTPCRSEGCLYHAYRLASASNRAADPCVDFYAYVCGRWRAFHKGARSQAEDAAMTLAVDVISSLERPLASNRVVGNLVSTCVANKIGVSADAFIGVAKLLGLPMSAEDKFSGHPMDHLVRLCLRWNLHLVFGLRVVSDNRKPFLLLTRHRKHVVPEVRSAASRYARTHVRKHINAFASADVQLLRAVQEDFFNAVNFEREDQTLLTLANLTMATTSVQEWMTFLNAHSRSQQVFDESSLIVLENVGMVKSLDGVLTKYKREDVVASVCWVFVEEYLWLLTDLRSNDSHATAKETSDMESDSRLLQRHRPAACLAYVDTFLGLLSGANHIKDTFPESSQRQLNEIFESIDKELIILANASTWIDAKTKERVVAKARKVQRDVWPEVTVLSIEALLALHSKMRTSKHDNFLAVLTNSRSLLGNERYSDVLFGNLKSTPLGAAGYIYHVNRVLMSVAVIGAPFFYPHTPSSVNYGGLTSVYASQLLRLLDKTGATYSSNDSGALWMKESITEYRQRADCQMADVQRVDHVPLLPFLAALEVAYAAFSRQPDQDITIDAVELGPTSGAKLFFMSYCHALCGKERSGGAEECNFPLRNFLPFAATFDCSPGTWMSAGKCSIFGG